MNETIAGRTAGEPRPLGVGDKRPGGYEWRNRSLSEAWRPGGGKLIGQEITATDLEFREYRAPAMESPTQADAGETGEAIRKRKLWVKASKRQPPVGLPVTLVMDERTRLIDAYGRIGASKASDLRDGLLWLDLDAAEAIEAERDRLAAQCAEQAARITELEREVEQREKRLTKIKDAGIECLERAEERKARIAELESERDELRREIERWTGREYDTANPIVATNARDPRVTERLAALGTRPVRDTVSANEPVLSCQHGRGAEE